MLSKKESIKTTINTTPVIKIKEKFGKLQKELEKSEKFTQESLTKIRIAEEHRVAALNHFRDLKKLLGTYHR